MPSSAPVPVTARTPLSNRPNPASVSASDPRSWAWIAGLVLVGGGFAVLAVLLLNARRRQKQGTDRPLTRPAATPAPQPPQPTAPPTLAPLPPPPPMEPPKPRVTAPVIRPWLEVDFVPRRAGQNLTGAAVEFELAVRNIGSRPATDVRVLVQLLTANPQQNAHLAAAFGQPVDNPVIAPFELAPGELISVNGFGTLPLDKISQVEMQGRPMFVPIMAVRVVYGWAENRGPSGSTANAYILGIDRDGQNKMQPFWMDQGPRMADRIAYRLHDMGIRQ
ncbi:MAG: hypothetical protein B7Y43_18670 [Sphingomonas sp. 28-62-20]|nr:MAG: hypothetical protein B7Y43_18670 [Sphingomonas sp. 28-62-20]